MVHLVPAFDTSCSRMRVLLLSLRVVKVPNRVLENWKLDGLERLWLLFLSQGCSIRELEY